MTLASLPALPSFNFLDRSQCDAIHAASLEILRRTGVRVYHPEAVALLRAAGATVTDDSLVRLPPALVEGMSDSCALDEQAAIDSTFSVMVALLTGTNLVHDVGCLEPASRHRRSRSF